MSNCIQYSKQIWCMHLQFTLVLVHLHDFVDVVHFLTCKSLLAWYILIVCKFLICLLSNVLVIQVFKFFQEQSVAAISRPVTRVTMLLSLLRMHSFLDNAILLVVLLWCIVLSTAHRTQWDHDLWWGNMDCWLLNGEERIRGCVVNDSIWSWSYHCGVSVTSSFWLWYEAGWCLFLHRVLRVTICLLKCAC